MPVECQIVIPTVELRSQAATNVGVVGGAGKIGVVVEALHHTKALVVPADAQRRSTTATLGATVANVCKVDGVGGIGGESLRVRAFVVEGGVTGCRARDGYMGMPPSQREGHRQVDVAVDEQELRETLAKEAKAALTRGQVVVHILHVIAAITPLCSGRPPSSHPP